MSHFVSSALIATLLFGGASVSAQPAPPPRSATQSPPPAPDRPDIVVTGERQLEQQVRSFVRALTPARSGDQLARFETAFCPTVWGLIPEQNQAVATRLRAVAAAAGVEVGGANCSPNAFVIAVDEKRTFIEGLARARAAAFGQLSALQIRRLAVSGGPAAAWQLTQQVDAGGMPVGDDLINQTTEFASRITASGRRVFEAAAVVIEKGSLTGLTTTQVADYSAMRLLANTDPSRLRSSSSPTILTAIEAPMGSEVPITLTQWDLSFLRGYYAAPDNVFVNRHRADIARQVRDDLEKPR